MTGFSYTQRNTASRCVIAVKLHGRLLGHIKGGLHGAGGFRYFPKGSTKSGAEYRTVEDVKRSIEVG